MRTEPDAGKDIDVVTDQINDMGVYDLIVVMGFRDSDEVDTASISEDRGSAEAGRAMTTVMLEALEKETLKRSGKSVESHIKKPSDTIH